METTKSNAKLIGGLVAGAAIGGLLGVLFAPRKGSETRKKILAKGANLTGELKDKIHHFVSPEKKEAYAAKEMVNDFAKEGAAKSK